MVLGSIPVFIQETMHLQCFPPTRYVRGGASGAHNRDDLYLILSKLILLVV